MGITSKIDEFGLAAWITILVLAFAAAWPLGLVVLAYLAFSGRLSNWVKGEKSDMFKARGRWHSPCGKNRSSGNAAFDEYKEETLKRLEDEQNDFHAFLDRLRQAKDKAEFDQFMADRKGNGQDSGEAAQA
jgi:hypothetical protein